MQNNTAKGVIVVQRSFCAQAAMNKRDRVKNLSIDWPVGPTITGDYVNSGTSVHFAPDVDISSASQTHKSQSPENRVSE